MIEKIKNLIKALFTSSCENSEVNYEPIAKYAKHLSNNRLKAFFIHNSFSEGYMLTEEKRIKLTKKWVEVALQDFKVIVHVESTCVKMSYRLAI